MAVIFVEPVHQITETEKMLQRTIGEQRKRADLLEVSERLQNSAVVMAEF